ncbi:MAG TPA: YXWGXW repeat-containing protein, partial [Candidatus Aquilonibacter sp.]
MARLSKIIALLTLACTLAMGMPARSNAAVFVGLTVSYGPPALPYYDQPPAPAPNLIWQPGYWAWGPYGYYWVPGTWVAAPEPDMYWTPGYWAYDAGQYQWNGGYWGPQVGFYGGVNYGYGYFGNGYDGGRWNGRNFQYNTAYSNVNQSAIRNRYYSRATIDNREIVNRYGGSRISYNGGPRGIAARATTFQRQAYTQRRFAMTAQQQQHVTYARQATNLRYNVNHGKPAIAAAPRPFSRSYRPTAVPARYHAIAAPHAAAPAAAHHAAPAAVHHAAPAAVHHATPAAVHHAAPAAVHHAAPARPAYHAAPRPAYHAAPR